MLVTLKNTQSKETLSLFKILIIPPNVEQDKTDEEEISYPLNFAKMYSLKGKSFVEILRKEIRRDV